MINQFLYRDKQIESKLELSGDAMDVTIGDKKYRVTPLSTGRYAVELNGVKTPVSCVVKDNKSYIDIDGLLLELTIPSEDGGTAAGAGGHAAAKDKIFAPMPGRIVKLLVKEGETVKSKQPMVIVEAMKMENQVNSAAEGVVKKINFKDGDQVDTETPIIELEIES
jgi:biotin carboxyl carrier protein